MPTRRLSVPILCAIFCVGISASAQARKVQVAVPGFSQNMAFSAAKLAGYYQAEDLDVEFVLMSAGTAVQALIGGSVDFALVGGAAVTSILRGAPIGSFWLLFTGPSISFMRSRKSAR